MDCELPGVTPPDKLTLTHVSVVQANIEEGRIGSEEEEEEAAQSWVDIGEKGKMVPPVEYVWAKVWWW